MGLNGFQKNWILQVINNSDSTGMNWTQIKDRLKTEYGIEIKENTVNFNVTPTSDDIKLLTSSGIINGENIDVINNEDGTVTINCKLSKLTQIQSDWNQQNNNEVDFIKNKPTPLKGDKGDVGEQGIQGIQGLKGEQGTQGIQGNKGEQGNTGNGIEKIESLHSDVSHSTAVEIYMTDETSHGFDVPDGKDGVGVEQNLDSVMKKGNIAGVELDMNMFPITNVQQLHFMEDDLEKECLINFNDGKLEISFVPALTNSVITNKGFEGSINNVAITNTLTDDVFLNGTGEYVKMSSNDNKITWGTSQPNKQGDEMSGDIYIQYQSGQDYRSLLQGDIISIWKYNTSIYVQNWQEYPANKVGDKYLSETTRIRADGDKILFEIKTQDTWNQVGEMGL